METILSRIDNDGLRKDIDVIAGPEFLEQIRFAHAAYKPMVQAMLRRDTKGEVNLLEHVRGMGRAIVDYATKICGTADEDDKASVTAVRKALQPIVAHREAAGRRGDSAASGDAEPVTEPVEK
jgi:hypothetical protein